MSASDVETNVEIHESQPISLKQFAAASTAFLRQVDCNLLPVATKPVSDVYPSNMGELADMAFAACLRSSKTRGGGAYYNIQDVIRATLRAALNAG